MRIAPFAGAALVACLAVAWAQSAVPPTQPVPFNHKVHSALGVKCLDCHSIKPPGDLAGYPAVNSCMGCHATVKKESAAVQKLARYAAERTPVPWVRVYKLPKAIYFSHEVHHRKAKIDCVVCHGPVAERELIVQEKSIA